jgi:hypothetical protein
MPVTIRDNDDGRPPESLVDRAADSAFNHIEEFLVAEGRQPKSVFIILRLEPDGSGEVDSTVASRGLEDAKDTFATLLSFTIQTGEELGLKILVAPMGKG